MTTNTSKIRWLTFLLCLTVLFSATLTRISAAEMQGDEWDPISTSKTATELDQGCSDVTLTIGHSSTQYDIVFVMDNSSCTDDAKEAMSELLNKLIAGVNRVNADAVIKVGAVKFKGGATTADFPLTPMQSLGERSWDTYLNNTAAQGPGTNMHAGLLSAQAMLDADTEVPAENKYLVLISDGITYLWSETVDGASVSYGINYYENGLNKLFATPSVWEKKYGKGYVPADWDAYLRDVAQGLEEVMAYACVCDRSGYSSQPAINYTTEEGNRLLTSVDVSLYKCYEVWAQMQATGYQTYAVTIPNENYPFATPFVTNVLNRGQAECIDKILDKVLNQIVYRVLDKGSYVTDYIGCDDAADGTGYTFRFVNDAAALTLKVGGVPLSTVKLEENRYGFGTPSDGQYPYELTYYPESADGAYFVWNIHVPVESLLPVQLTYQVELTQAPTVEGTHRLYTNTKAVLTAVDTDGATTTRTLERPWVSYTVEAQTISIAVSKIWQDGEDYASTRPEEITVVLYANGVKTTKTLTLKASDGWVGSFTGLKAEEDGAAILYSVRELPVDGYFATYEGNQDAGFTITNSIQPAPPTGIALDSLPWMIAGGAALLSIALLLTDRIRNRRCGGADAG